MGELSRTSDLFASTRRDRSLHGWLNGALRTPIFEPAPGRLFYAVIFIASIAVTTIAAAVIVVIAVIVFTIVIAMAAPVSVAMVIGVVMRSSAVIVIVVDH